MFPRLQGNGGDSIAFARQYRILVRAGGRFFRRAPDLLADRLGLLVRDKAQPLSTTTVFALAGLLRPAALLVLCSRPQPLKNGSGLPHSKERYSALRSSLKVARPNRTRWPKSKA